MTKEKPEAELPTGVPETSSLRTRETLLAAVFAGVLAALGELALQGARQLRGVAVIDQSPLVAWMAPLGGVAAFLCVGLLLVILGMVFRRLRRTDIVAFILAFLVCASVFTLLPMVHAAATTLLAAGVAVQVGWWAGRNSKKAMRWVTTGAAWLVPLAVGVGVGGDLWQRVTEARAIAGLPEPAEEAPNVLLLILDTVRGENLSLHGYERETTPELTALAGESVVFDRAIAPSPWTLPTHASIFTGLWPHELSADWLDPLDETAPVLAEALADRGFATAGFVANLVYTHRGWGLARGFSRYEDFPVSAGQVINSLNLGRIVSNLPLLRRAIGFHDVLNRKSAEALNQDLLRWVDGLEEGRPFFAFVNYFDAHEPLFPPAPFDTMFGPAGIVGPFKYSAQKVHPTNRYAWSEQRIQAERDAYDGALAYLDRSIRELLDALDARGLFENTLVIVTSDHGEQFGEHRLLAHGNSVYTQVTHVPLLIRMPGTVPDGARIDATVSVTEIPATVMEIVAPDTALFPGSSLSRFWRRGARAAPDTVIAEVTGGFAESDWEPIASGDVRSAFVGRWHYIINADGRMELYDIVEDPREERNLAGEEMFADRLAAARAAFEAEWTDTGRQPRLRR